MSSAEVKPWEPVRHQYGWNDGFMGRDWLWDREAHEDISSALRNKDIGFIAITLVNGQRIIVRALSEERKAARRMRREVVS